MKLATITKLSAVLCTFVTISNQPVFAAASSAEDSNSEAVIEHFQNSEHFAADFEFILNSSAQWRKMARDFHDLIQAVLYPTNFTPAQFQVQAAFAAALNANIASDATAIGQIMSSDPSTQATIANLVNVYMTTGEAFLLNGSAANYIQWGVAAQNLASFLAFVNPRVNHDRLLLALNELINSLVSQIQSFQTGTGLAGTDPVASQAAFTASIQFNDQAIRIAGAIGAHLAGDVLEFVEGSHHHHFSSH